MIPDARCAELPGADELPYVGDSDALLDVIQEFLTGAKGTPDLDRSLATVLFTDIVGSTRRAAELGDQRWRSLLAAHDRAVRAEVDRHRGREIKNTGDGFLAIFDGPARAVRAAAAIRDALRPLGLEVRSGLHTGEIALVDDDVTGIAVHIGARISGLAGAGEILVSSTVKDLVVGSGIAFEQRGAHALKGVPDEWRVFAALL
jgi:class 3 adenylate cyclase